MPAEFQNAGLDLLLLLLPIAAVHAFWTLWREFPAYRFVILFLPFYAVAQANWSAGTEGLRWLAIGFVLAWLCVFLPASIAVGFVRARRRARQAHPAPESGAPRNR